MPSTSDVWPGQVDIECLHGPQGDWQNATVIVPAVYREWHGHGPPVWLQQQHPVYLYQRRNASVRCFCANRGYESGVYFRFIAMHYARLPAAMAFVQADWIFQTKTNMGHPFQFWQPLCFGTSAGDSPWRDYMPLGGRRSVWPPRCVVRQTSWYTKFIGQRNAPVVEACTRELLQLIGWRGTVRPYDRTRPLNVTFYTNMNFLASRARLQRYSHGAYNLLARRFVDEGVCVPPRVRSGEGGNGGVSSDGFDSRRADATTSAAGLAASGGDGLASVVDSAQFGKITLGMVTEFLQQSLFGDAPLENGPPPAVPVDAQHCAQPAPTRCSR